MKNNKKTILSLLIVLIFSAGIAQATVPELPDEAIDNALPNIPEQGLVHAMPFNTRVIESENLIAYVRPLYATIDDPAKHEVTPGTPLDGVTKLILTRTDFTGLCTGTLLATTAGNYVLTAAHCVTDVNGNNVFVSGTATFTGATTNESISIAGVDIHPNWDGDYIRGNDLAILTLSHSPASEINRYDIDRSSRSDVNSISEKIGYGISGMSQADSSTYPAGIKRAGMNKYDATADKMYRALGLSAGVDYVRNAILQYDFDDGTAAHDAFGFFFGINDTGLGNDEVMSAPGDSGGPTIKNGLIQGVTSYGLALTFTNGASSDINDLLDSSVGEFGGDTYVAIYAKWIDSVTGGSSSASGDSTGGSTGGCSTSKQRRGLC